MKLRHHVRRFALTAAVALALVPATATAAAAQSPDDLCALRDDAPDEMAPLLDALAPVIDAICAEDDGDPGDGDNGDGPTGTPLDDLLDLLDPDQLPLDELCGLRDQAPEEMAPLLEALAPVLDAICPAGEEEEEEPTPTPTPTPTPDDPTPEPTPSPEAEVDDEDDVDLTTDTRELPVTGGSLALAGLALMGSAVGIRRFFGSRG